MGRRVFVAYGIAGFVFLYLPIVFLVLFSFNDHIIPSFPFRGFTLKWYDELGFDFVMHEALYNSLYVATATTLVSTVLGTLAAFPLVRCAFRLKRALQALVIVPMVIPHFLMGVALLLFFSWLRLPLSRLTIILGHVVFTLPFATLLVSARLYGFDRTLELAAGDLGARPRQVFWYVTLPLILPGVVGAALLVFTLSMDEFLITFFVSGQKGTLTMHIWSLLRDGIAPRVNALATVLLGASFVLLGLGGWLIERGRGRATA
ncbi:MAG TPA: ABC transporter permease [Methylomirabilota bacterium]|jgi:spermidine/putrescine transport system permease protein|nr:ABC transporter permease [Methylomirabilota bacterium]